LELGAASKAELVEILIFFAAARTGDHEISSARLVGMRIDLCILCFLLLGNFNTEELLANEDVVAMNERRFSNDANERAILRA